MHHCPSCTLSPPLTLAIPSSPTLPPCRFRPYTPLKSAHSNVLARYPPPRAQPIPDLAHVVPRIYKPKLPRVVRGRVIFFMMCDRLFSLTFSYSLLSSWIDHWTAILFPSLSALHTHISLFLVVNEMHHLATHILMSNNLMPIPDRSSSGSGGPGSSQL